MKTLKFNETYGIHWTILNHFKLVRYLSHDNDESKMTDRSLFFVLLYFPYVHETYDRSLEAQQCRESWVKTV